MNPLPVTLIVGGEDVLAQRAVSEAMAAAAKRSPEPVERRLVDGAADEAAAELAEALSPTLFGDAAVVIIRNGDCLDDAAMAVLQGAIADPPDAVELVVLHPNGVKGKKILTTLRAAATSEVACPAMKKGKDTIAFLTMEVRRHGRKATSDAIRILYDAVGHDPAMLVAAVSQLCSDIEADPIDGEAVQRYFAGVADVAGWQVSDAVWERRPVEALRDLRWMFEAGGKSAPGPAVTAAIGGGLRAVARVQGMPASLDQGEVARETGLPPWKVRIVQGQARRWRPDRLAAAVVHLADLDVAVKGGLREGESLDNEQKLHAMEKFVLGSTEPNAD